MKGRLGKGLLSTGFLFKDIIVGHLLKVGGKPADGEDMKSLMIFLAMLFHPEFKACSLLS